MLRTPHVAVLLAALLLAVGCASPLPEETSPGAQVLVGRCGECHRVYAPGSMTWPMWEYQLGRMKMLYTALHKPWLSAEERMLTDYLQRHAGGRS